MNRLRLASLVRRLALITGLGACLIGTGCGAKGGQTGGELPASGGGCERELQPFALDALTPLGVTAASVLEPVLGTHTEPLLWSANTGAVTIGPEQGLSEVELTATYGGGTIAWAHFVPATDEAGNQLSLLGCPPDQLEIDLDVALRTGGGALNERFVATLGAVAADNAQFTQRLLTDSLEGSFFVTAPMGTTAPAMKVTVLWDVFGFRGTLLGEVTMEVRDPNASSSSGGSVGFGYVPFADWPPPAGASGP